MGGFCGKFFAQVFTTVFVLQSVSLPVWAANTVAEDPVEKSSPEEPKPKSLPGLRAISQDAWPTVIPMQDWTELSEAQGLVDIPAGWGPGISPYQGNAITAIMAAGIVLAVQSLKEQGRIDHRAMWRLFNSTDLYAGIVGSMVASKGKDQAVKRGGALVSRFASDSFKEFGRRQSVQFFGAMMNSFSYMLAVSSGFEYFSQFWKLATRDIPNVSRVSDIVQAPLNDVIRVGSNLFSYVLNGDIQKRIIASIKYHRIWTFEFMAMNAGLFLGVVAGDLVAQRLGPKASEAVKKTWSQKLTREFSRLMGGVAGGVAIQFIPDGFRIRVNSNLLDWNISKVRQQLTDISGSIEQGVRYKQYPPYHMSSVGSFFAQKLNLQSDVRRLIRTRDLLYSLYAQKYFLVGMDDRLHDEISVEQEELDQKLLSWILRSGGLGPSSVVDLIDEKPQEAWGSAELENWIYNDIHKDEFQRHYTRVLYAGLQNLQGSHEDFEDFLTSLHEFQNSEDGEVLREIPTIPE